MIIAAGNRRLVSERFGWKIERKRQTKTGKNAGLTVWVEDRPAYPNSLAKGLEMIFEREVMDCENMAVSDLPDALKEAYHKVREYAEKARESV